MSSFKAFSGFYQDTELCRFTCSYHYCSGRCKSQWAWAGYNKHWYCHVKSKCEAIAKQQPYYQWNKSYRYNYRHEHSAYLVCKSWYRRFWSGSVFDKCDYLWKCWVFSLLLTSYLSKTASRYACTHNSVTHCLVYRYALACKCRLVNSAVSFNKNSVTWHRPACFEQEYISHHYAFRRNFHLLAVTDNNCRLRRKAHKLVYSISRLVFWASLKIFSHSDKCEYHAAWLII